ncbi:hypothetical protein C8R46DRAFT_1261892 [Mycena filopes]|nr:hypothetical protein C8R46DRAFT_1261892 [Mycena filopes]
MSPTLPLAVLAAPPLRSEAALRNNILAALLADDKIHIPSDILPALIPTAWDTIDKCSTARKLAEGRGDVVLTLLLGGVVRETLGNRFDSRTYTNVLQVVSQTALFHHLLVLGGRYANNAYRKAPANVLEILVGAWSEYATVPQLRQWARRMFSDVVETAIEANERHDYVPIPRPNKRNRDSSEERMEPEDRRSAKRPCYSTHRDVFSDSLYTPLLY